MPTAAASLGYAAGEDISTLSTTTIAMKKITIFFPFLGLFLFVEKKLKIKRKMSEI